MAEAQSLEAMTEEQLLDYADTCARTARRAEVDLLRVAYQWAVVHHTARLDPEEWRKPGRERGRQYGGAGTTPVTEFAAASLGARIGRSPYSAARLIGDAQDLAHRHPQLWSRVEALEVKASYACHVTRATRDLSTSQAQAVDAAVAESADGRIPWSRFEDLVTAQVRKAAPDEARAKEQAAAQARFAKKVVSRSSAKHGMASFLVRADLATITQIDAVVGSVAAALKSVMPEASRDDRRVHALMLLLHLKVQADSPARETPPEPEPDPFDSDLTDEPPAEGSPADEDHPAADLTGVELADLQDLRPTVQLFVHMYYGTAGLAADVESDEHGEVIEPIARVEGHGAVTSAWLRDTLGSSCRFRVFPVIDLAGQAPVDAYEIPERHRQAVHLMSPADVFPHAASLSRSKQIDHTTPFDHGPDDGSPPPGQSRIGNYGPLTTGHHRIKTHGGWQVQQPFPGIYVWRDPHGGFHLVDHTGTRRLTGDADHCPPRPKPLVIEIHHSPVRLEFDAAA